MRDQAFIRMPLVGLMVGLAVHAFVPGCQASAGNKQVPPEQQKRFEAMQAKGTKASLTVFPVVMGDSAALNKGVADVVAVLLEKAGMTNLETTDAVFRLPKEATFDRAAQLFGEFVRKNPIATEYALYAEFVGNPETGPKEIRSVIVDRTGQSVWVDRQTAADREFKRAKPRDPMTCCMFLAERVRTHLGIPKSARDDSGEGKIARRLAEKSPAPDKAEWAAMEQRQAIMKKAGRSATVAVYPVRLSDDETSGTNAAHLASLLNKKKLYQAKAVDSTLRVKIEPSRSMQNLLWGLARAFQDHVERNPPEADYALLADYIMDPRAGRGAWAVHFVICDRAGEWVIVDFQNDHHGDFQSVDPKTFDDCGRLVAKRLEGYLR
ncbi:MAG: hypothetical protein IIC01_08765 [Planctomycetes bacterium]|nr:hypothetical protein [Planctomycetota bacterium]